MLIPDDWPIEKIAIFAGMISAEYVNRTSIPRLVAKVQAAHEGLTRGDNYMREFGTRLAKSLRPHIGSFVWQQMIDATDRMFR